MANREVIATLDNASFRAFVVRTSELQEKFTPGEEHPQIGSFLDRAGIVDQKERAILYAVLFALGEILNGGSHPKYVKTLIITMEPGRWESAEWKIGMVPDVLKERRN